MTKAHKILVVDDTPLDLELLSALLESFGYEYETASSGAEALDKLSPAVDLLLSDVMMPNMDGFQLVSLNRPGFTGDLIV